MSPGCKPGPMSFPVCVGSGVGWGGGGGGGCWRGGGSGEEWRSLHWGREGCCVVCDSVESLARSTLSTNQHNACVRGFEPINRSGPVWACGARLPVGDL